ncbi:MAG: 4'-phosphopantetheinyl transferase superfamily protein [Brevinematales bacterium]|nr:4'-phosphopantetheinyl transferase superfamily protein [Brevinematales bacterium]
MELHLLIGSRERKRLELSHIARVWAMQRLKEYVGEEVIWAVDRWGKPFLFSHPTCHFNLAHSAEVVLLAIDSQPVGVDIEKSKPRDYEALAERFFHPEEKAWVIGEENRFYHIWTAKEAYLKAKGMGIRMRLSSFSVVKDKKLCSPEEGWYLLPLFLGERLAGYWACLCARHKLLTSFVLWEEKKEDQGTWFLSERIDTHVFLAYDEEGERR